MEKNHESKQLTKLNSNSSLLRIAINAIANIELDDNHKNSNDSLEPFRIEDKIEFNCIKRNRALIEEYSIFYSKINLLYNELEQQGSFKKEKLLRTIKLLYVKSKGRYSEVNDNPMDYIRNNADNIIEDVENNILQLIEKDKHVFIEDISFGISIIMVDAFMRCKILEEPIKS